MTAYAAYMLPRLQSLENGIRDLTQQNARAARNPLLLADTEWLVTAAVAVAVIKTSAEQLQTPPSVPPEAQAAHSSILRASRDFINMSDEYARGIDDIRAGRGQAGTARLERAASQLESAGQTLGRAARELEDATR